MRALGHPLVGDATYDGGALARAPRLMLHARAGHGSAIQNTAKNKGRDIIGRRSKRKSSALRMAAAEAAALCDDCALVFEEQSGSNW